MMMNKQTAVIVLLASLWATNSLAAGKIEFITGNVTINNVNNEMRVPHRDEKVETGDTVITGSDGEVHIITDDQGVIAVRPKTQLLFDTYQAKGLDDDSVVLTLLRGSFRSITGWIAKKNRTHYQVKTPTATIGVRGTDHEPLVIENGANAGTYDKVNTGITVLDSPFGQVEIKSQQAGFVPKSAKEAPKVLTEIPAVFQPSANEAHIEEIKQQVLPQQDEHFKQLQENQLKNGGGIRSGAVAKAKIGDFDDQRKASLALDELLRQYEIGNVNVIRNRLDPSMIGFQRLLDGIATEANQCKQMRIRLYDTQVQAGSDLAVIQTHWEKRCLMLPNFSPRINTGFTTFLMHKAKTAWGLAALSNDNPFASFVQGTNATLAVSGSLSCATIYNSSVPFTFPFNITLTDPDLATASTAIVTLTTTQGESEPITLSAVGGGVFTSSSLTVSHAAPMANNGSVEVAPVVSAAAFFTVTCPAVTVKYTDTTTTTGVPLTVQGSVSIP